ncbi:hypothetical protein MN032_03935 [Agromyces atrinae]|uniref:hypothetical protein n=1 Tax=Agromyces atrinae TaxID=592376 RepID=UPI001F5922AC|nr:hypothetical protein [Agromyces atrinae]MCI2956834.1 hypothetical protein [Agromyces atrinae]
MTASRFVPTPIDTRPLTDRIDRTELAAFRDTLPKNLRSNSAPNIVGVLLFYAALLAFVTLGAVIIGIDQIGYSPQDDARRLLYFGVYLAPVILGAVIVFRAIRRRRISRTYRLHRFAEANGLSHQPVGGMLLYPGMIFRAGHSIESLDVITGADGSTVVGNYAYSTGSGKSQRSFRWGFASIALGTSLPHIVLDATGNNSLFGGSNLPVGFSRDQHLELEGDFSKHFTLYCPRGYESDALYLFTPDIMARFIDHAAELDVEIIDDRMYLYSKRDLSTIDPATWVWLTTTIAALSEKIDRWQRWRDARLGNTYVADDKRGIPQIIRPPRGVASSGRRLSQRTGWIGIILMGVLFLFGAYSIIEDIVTAITR